MQAHTHPFHPGFFAMSEGPGRGRRGGRGRHGGGPWGFPGHRGPRARRGDVRTALLVLLAEEPRNGYQLMQEIEQRSDGTWRPSPGSVYPALQQLEDEGLVAAGTGEAGRFYEITEAGRKVVAERGDAPAPWDAAKEDTGPGPRQLMQLVRAVAMAAAQIVQAGDDAQVAQAQEVLRDARRSLYRILAEDPPGDEA
jgi:DNA-binding PadR family transcriptional regulator